MIYYHTEIGVTNILKSSKIGKNYMIYSGCSRGVKQIWLRKLRSEKRALGNKCDVKSQNEAAT